MLRTLAAIAAFLLLMAGAFLIWKSRAETAPRFPSAHAAGAYSASMLSTEGPLRAPDASPQSREERRFSRADKNKDGKVDAEELLGARRKAFAKLDANGNGSLSFEEWAAKTIGKFQGADKDRNGVLTAAEYATTAPPPPKHRVCSCNAPTRIADNSDD